MHNTIVQTRNVSLLYLHHTGEKLSFHIFFVNRVRGLFHSKIGEILLNKIWFIMPDNGMG